jgi:hypothetical protein
LNTPSLNEVSVTAPPHANGARITSAVRGAAPAGHGGER